MPWRLGFSVARHRRARWCAGARDRTVARAVDARGSRPEQPLRRDALGAADWIHAGDAGAAHRRSSASRATDFTVLLEGESGVGKELVARQIHELQPAPRRPVRRGQLRGARRDAARSGAVRHRRAHRDRRPRPARQVRSTPTAARCSSTKCRTCRRRRRPSCCARFRISRSSASADTAAPRRHPHRRGDQSQPVATLVEQRLFRPTCSIASAAWTSACRRCASGAPTLLELAQHFLERHAVVRPLRLSRAARRRADGVRLAGKRARAGARHRARRRAGDRRGHRHSTICPTASSGDYGIALAPSLRRNDALRTWASRYARLVLDRCGGNKRAACRALDIAITR